jgi:hypothetical protein
MGCRGKGRYFRGETFRSDAVLVASATSRSGMVVIYRGSLVLK